MCTTDNVFVVNGISTVLQYQFFQLEKEFGQKPGTLSYSNNEWFLIDHFVLNQRILVSQTSIGQVIVQQRRVLLKQITDIAAQLMSGRSLEVELRKGDVDELEQGSVFICLCIHVILIVFLSDARLPRVYNLSASRNKKTSLLHKAVGNPSDLRRVDIYNQEY